MNVAQHVLKVDGVSASLCVTGMRTHTGAPKQNQIFLPYDLGYCSTL